MDRPYLDANVLYSAARSATTRLAERRTTFAALALLVLMASPAPAASGPRPYLKKSDDWFASREAQRIAASILSYQSELAPGSL